MAGLLTESTAVLRERANKIGLPTAALDRLIAQGVTTMAKLAFAPGQPGETPTEEKLKSLIKEGSDEPSLGSVAAIRHLVFEAQTLMLSETKALIEHREEQAKELPPAERRERIKKQASRLSGLNLSGANECSFGSYDLVLKLVVENTVTYLAPNRFTDRQSELRAEKPNKSLDVSQSGGSLIVKEKPLEQWCETTTSLSLYHAMHRRSLAMDLVGLTTYSRSQAWVDFLINHLQETPMQGFKPATLQQILHADRAAWVRLAELTPDGVRRNNAGDLPLDDLWEELQSDPKVMFHLLPHPGTSGKASSSHQDGASAQGTDDEPAAKRLKPSKEKKGKGKGKGKTLPEPANLPAELKGLSSWTRTGKRRCWSFNMACGCTSAKAGQTCPKGLHVCMRCGGMHPAHQCPKRPS